MVQITLENDKVGAREVEEQIGGFVVKLPVGEPSAPEWVLFVDPFALLFVLLTWQLTPKTHTYQALSSYLPAHTQTTKTILLLYRGLRE